MSAGVMEKEPRQQAPWRGKSLSSRRHAAEKAVSAVVMEKPRQQASWRRSHVSRCHAREVMSAGVMQEKEPCEEVSWSMRNHVSRSPPEGSLRGARGAALVAPVSPQVSPAP